MCRRGCPGHYQRPLLCRGVGKSMALESPENRGAVRRKGWGFSVTLPPEGGRRYHCAAASTTANILLKRWYLRAGHLSTEPGLCDHSPGTAFLTRVPGRVWVMSRAQAHGNTCPTPPVSDPQLTSLNKVLNKAAPVVGVRVWVSGPQQVPLPSLLSISEMVDLLCAYYRGSCP